ncbi:DUF1492 domain-containing protein [Anaerococcus sp. DFU013_CI05]|uniref:DUF1492 domain-containing protein n=1 Tax=Anaerococcus sp. AH8042_DFU013_CI05 TaxID=3385202 RepID=UPI003A52280E
MNAKEYLKQAFYLDKRINSKLEQVESLNTLATKATSTLSDMPKSPSRGTSRLEETIVKIIDLQEEINRDIDKLVDLKKEIANSIFALKDKEEQTVLEKRYLCFESWEKIAVDMNYSIQYCFNIHRNALKAIDMKF